jgi:hypothetical protein
MMGEDVSLRSAQGEAVSAIEGGEGKIVVGCFCCRRPSAWAASPWSSCRSSR